MSSNYASYGQFGKRPEPVQGNVIEIQSAEHKQQLLEQSKQTGQLLLVDIWGSWCGPCKQVRPAYEELSIKYPTVMFCAEDVTMGLTPEATVVPWFQFFGQGQVLENKKGADIVGIEQTILKYLQNHPVPQPQAPPRNPKFAPGPPPGGYLPGGGYAQGGPPPNQQPATRYQQPGMYAPGPPVTEPYQGAPSMGAYPIQAPAPQRPGGPHAGRPPTFDMQRPTRTPHGIRPAAHRPMY